MVWEASRKTVPEIAYLFKSIPALSARVNILCRTPRSVRSKYERLEELTEAGGWDMGIA